LEEGQHIDDSLGSMPFFAGLDREVLADVQRAASLFSVEAGRVLFRQNDEADGIYLISRGRVRVLSRAPGNDIVDLVEIGPGDIIGELSLLDSGRRSATAQTIEATTGFFVSLQRFESLRRVAYPSISKLIDRIRVVVARRTRAVVAAIASEPVVAGAAPLRTRSVSKGGHARSGIVSSRPDGVEPLLACLPTFSDFSSDEIRNLLEMCDWLHAPRGAVLLERGERLEFLFIVVRGALRASIVREAEFEQLLIYGPGALVETVSFTDDGQIHTHIDVREDALLLRIARGHFETLQKSHSDLAFKILHQINIQLVGNLRRLNCHLGRVRGILRFNDHQKVFHV
jgi:CRP-like cAMP-binding protein